MGFTPLEGLVMATRSGSVDPGLLLWLLEREAIDVREMAEALEHDAGLLALAGTPDMREVLGRAATDDRARLAHAADEYADVSATGAPVRTLVVRAREDLEIAGQVRALLG